MRRNIHDDSLPVNVQCTSVRLLLNLVEVMFARRQDMRVAEAHRMLLVRSLDAFVSKLSAIKRSLEDLLPLGESRCVPSCPSVRPWEGMLKEHYSAHVPCNIPLGNFGRVRGPFGGTGRVPLASIGHDKQGFCLLWQAMWQQVKELFRWRSGPHACDTYLGLLEMAQSTVWQVYISN